MRATLLYGSEEGRQLFGKLDSVVRKFLDGKIHYLGAVPQDSALEKAVRQQKPVTLYSPNSKAAAAFEAIAKTIAKTNITEDKSSKNTKWGIFKLIDKFVTR